MQLESISFLAAAAAAIPAIVIVVAVNFIEVKAFLLHFVKGLI